MTFEPIEVPAPRQMAAKFLGGFVPAVAYHFGVLEVLQERGFVLRSGFRGPDEPRQTGPPGFDLVVGSSAGAFFVVAACAGATRDDLIGAIEAGEARFDPFDAKYLGQGDGLLHKTLDWAREGPRPSWKNRRTWRAWAAESTLNTLFPLWKLDSIEHYLRQGILGGRSWKDLRSEAAILGVDLNHPVTFISGERESPILQLFRDEPVGSETIHRILGSEGYKIVAEFEAAGVPRDHPVLVPLVAQPWRRLTSISIRGVPMATAAVGSMATFPFYAPIRFIDESGNPYRLGHYRVVVEDGEDRNPFTTDVAEDAGADLIIISSISAPYKYLHGLGSLSERGYGDMHYQKSAHSRDSKQENVIRMHRDFRRLYETARELLDKSECGPNALAQLRAAFHEVARIDNTRIRITPDPDVAAENHILRTLDPLEFSPQAVHRAFTLGQMVAKRVLKRYRFEFLD